jgi:hypothetical protein
MLGDTVLNRDLDEFITVPAFKGSVLVRPSSIRRSAYTLALVGAALLAITGLANVVSVLGQAGASAGDTATLGLGFVMILLALGLGWRFAAPLAFAAVVTEEALSWRSLFGWHSVPWDEIDFALVEPHSRLGARQVHVGAGKRILHYGWFDATDWYTTGPLESLPADEAKALTHTIVSRARLKRRQAGVWVNDRRSPPVEPSSGRLKW